jgi:hypothetical protein
MKFTRKIVQISLVLTILMAFCALVFADIPIQRVKSVSIQTKKDFPDFNFYLCRVPVSSYYNQGRHYTSHYEKLDLVSIQVSSTQPYLISDADSGDEIYFIAVGKDSSSKDIVELKKDVIAKLTKKEENGVYSFYIDTKSQKQTSEATDQHTVFTIENIRDEKSSSNQQVEASGVEIVRKTEDSNTFWVTTIASGLLLSGALIIIGLVIARKSRQK